MESIIRLFRAVLIETKKRKKPSKKVLERIIKSGFLLNNEIIGNYSDTELEKIITKIEEIVGLSGSQANSSFHKSWKKIKEIGLEQLVVEQLVHYLTTYGFERLGIYDESTIYIPNEILDIPSLKIEKLSLILIRGYTKEELKQKLLSLLNSGIALKEDTIKDVLDVATYLQLDINEIETIKNREVKIALYDYLAIVPENPVELLRYLIFKATNKTLLIKNKETIIQIKERNNLDILGILERYRRTNGLEKLAEIFYRFKPLFLAFRTSAQLKRTINRIRKLAIKNHRPMPEDYLNTVTSKIKHDEEIVLTELKEELERVNTFRKIRLAYALKYRTHKADSILYKIRNGKGYATDFNFGNKVVAGKVLKTVIKAIAKDIESNVSGKKIYVPRNVSYTLPATEKQFTGMFPSGTCVTLPKDMIVGVYWENVNGNRIDLDLSLIGLDVKFGWDAEYRNEKRSILFSGDMTDAHEGASELYYISKQLEGIYLIFLNYFNFDEKIPVPFKILVGYELVNNFRKNYIINPNNIVAVTNSIANQKQKALGLLIVRPEKTTFYFSEVNIGKSISSSQTKWAENARRYLLAYHENMISLEEILLEAGAKLTNDPNRCDIDLSPGRLEKDSFVNILKQT
jgi:hypothetical protein